MIIIEYRTKIELHFRKGLGFYLAFGVRVYHHRHLSIYIPDVFCRRQQALEFVDLCNKEQLEPIHLYDVIEDVI